MSEPRLNVGVVRELTVQQVNGTYPLYLLYVRKDRLYGVSCYHAGGLNVAQAVFAAGEKRSELDGVYLFSQPCLTFLGNCWRVHELDQDPAHAPILFYPRDSASSDTTDVNIFGVPYSTYVDMFDVGQALTPDDKNATADVLAQLLNISRI